MLLLKISKNISGPALTTLTEGLLSSGCMGPESSLSSPEQFQGTVGFVRVQGTSHCTGHLDTALSDPSAPKSRPSSLQLTVFICFLACLSQCIRAPLKARCCIFISVPTPWAPATLQWLARQNLTGTQCSAILSYVNVGRGQPRGCRRATPINTFPQVTPATFRGLLPCAKHTPSYLMCTGSFNFHRSPMSQVLVLLSLPFYEELRFAEAKYLSDVLLVTMLESQQLIFVSSGVRADRELK